MPAVDAFVARTAADQTGLNTLVVLTYPVRFQLAPGAADGIGIEGAEFVVSAAGVEIARGKTDANGEVPVPIAPLLLGAVTIRILGTDYVLSFQPQDKPTVLRGQQQRLDKLGYMSGYQLQVPGSAAAADNQDGPRTQQAFMNFQCDENLTLDGVIGPQSRGRLVEKTGD